MLVFSCSALAVVDIGDIGVGARSLGMGKATVGGLDDASAIFTNPAALSLNPQLNITSMSGTLLTDVNYMMFGAAETAPIGRVGIGYLNAAVSGITITQITGSGSNETVVPLGTTDYSSSVVYLSYSSALSRFLRGKGDNVLIGANLKYFLQGFSGGGATMQDAAGTGMDADLGLLWQVNNWANLGLTFNNFLPETFGGRFNWQKNNQTEGIAMVSRAGGRFNLIGPSGLKYLEKQKLDLLVEYASNNTPNWPAVWHLGAEYVPLPVLTLRAGIDQKVKATIGGIGVDNNLSLGVGLQYAGFTFDYAYHQFGEVTENTTHFFSFGFRGRDEVDREPLREPERNVPVPTVIPKPPVKSFGDVPESYWARRPIEYLATLGIMSGYPDETFKPDRPLTRGEFAALLVKAKGFLLSKDVKKLFKDVPTTNWLAPYVQLAVDRKYIQGYPDKTFQPNKKISRAEAAVVFTKFAGLQVKSKLSNDVFPGLAKGHWAAPAVSAGKVAGFYEFLADKNFEPGQDLTRAEAAEILSKTPFIKDKIRQLISGEK